jgi:hypothetical protein
MLLSVMAVLSLAGTPVSAQIRRLPDGKPNLSGIWQAMNTANWDLEEHGARRLGGRWAWSAPSLAARA